MRLGFLSSQDFVSIQKVYRQFILSLPATYTRESLLQALTHDKKNKAGEIRFVCIDKIGHAVPFENAYVRTVSAQELEPTIAWMEQHYAPAYQTV
jgi:3-dehydroquinate synthetase